MFEFVQQNLISVLVSLVRNYIFFPSRCYHNIIYQFDLNRDRKQLYVVFGSSIRFRINIIRTIDTRTQNRFMRIADGDKNCLNFVLFLWYFGYTCLSSCVSADKWHIKRCRLFMRSKIWQCHCSRHGTIRKIDALQYVSVMNVLTNYLCLAQHQTFLLKNSIEPKIFYIGWTNYCLAKP